MTEEELATGRVFTAWAIESLHGLVLALLISQSSCNRATGFRGPPANRRGVGQHSGHMKPSIPGGKPVSSLETRLKPVSQNATVLAQSPSNSSMSRDRTLGGDVHGLHEGSVHAVSSKSDCIDPPSSTAVHPRQPPLKNKCHEPGS